MDEYVSSESLKDTFPCLDIVMVGGRTQEEHDANVDALLNSMKRYGWTLSEAKTIKAVPEINILGYCISNENTKPYPERLRPLLNTPAPQNAKSLKRALGMFAYYAKRVMNFSGKIPNLNSTKKFPLTSKALEELGLLKEEIAKASLRSIHENLPFVV